MRTFIENYLHFIKNCIRPHYEKLKPLKSGFIENSNFENNRDPWAPFLSQVNFELLKYSINDHTLEKKVPIMAMKSSGAEPPKATNVAPE